MLFLLTDSPQKLKLEKAHGVLIIHIYVSPSSSPRQSRFKENAKILSKTHHSRKYYNFKTEFSFSIKSALPQVTGRKIPSLVLKRMLELFLEISPLN